MAGRQRTREGIKRPSRVRHDQGLRIDGTKRPSRIRHEAKNHAERNKWGGKHTMKERLERPFWGIDGQGAGTDESHALVLLRSGDMLLRSGPLTLNFPICMAFLHASIPDDVEPVVFKLDWLVAMMCKSLPSEKLVELVNRESRADPKDPYRVRPVIAHGYGIDWLPHHFFSVRGPSGRNIRISDVHRFFGRSFIDALKETGITGPVSSRLSLDDSKARVFLLEALMARFREQCIEAGVVPVHWEGPGQGASDFMRCNGIKDYLSGAYQS